MNKRKPPCVKEVKASIKREFTVSDETCAAVADTVRKRADVVLPSEWTSFGAHDMKYIFIRVRNDIFQTRLTLFNGFFYFQVFYELSICISSRNCYIYFETPSIIVYGLV